MPKLKPILILQFFSFLFSIILQQTAYSFNFDDVKNSQPPKVTIEDVKGKISKELFFSIMASKCSQLANAETSSEGLKEILSPNMDNSFTGIIAFDSTGQPVTTWQEEYPKEYLVVPNSFAFDMILTNSYGLQYKTSDYYSKSQDNYKDSYYVCVNDFDAEIRDLLTYYIDGADWAIDQAKNRLQEWKDPKFISKWRDNLGDCYQPTYNFASDYNNFIQKQLEINKSEKFTKQKRIEAENELKRKEEERINIENIEKARLAELQHAKEIKALANKWKEFGVHQDILMSNIATYAGSVASGDLTTLVEFIDKLSGAKKWERKGQQFFLYQNNKDQATGETHKIVYVFYDLRQKRGNIWLERVVIDKQDYPSSKLIYLVMQVMSRQ